MVEEKWDEEGNETEGLGWYWDDVGGLEYWGELE